MYGNYSPSPPLHFVKAQISKFARRLAIIQPILVGSLVILIGLLYSILDEIIAIMQNYSTDLEALKIALTSLIEAHQEMFSIMALILILVLISEIMYLIAFFKLARNFSYLARIFPQISKTAHNAGNFIRIALFIQIASILLGLISVAGLTYVSDVANIIAFGLLVAAYYYISQTFKTLRENNLYQKKESKLLLYSQITPVTAMIPLTFTIIELTTGKVINLIPLIIGLVIIGLGYIGLMVGFYQLSKDVMLIEDTGEVEYAYETSASYVPTQHQPIDYSRIEDTTSKRVNVQEDNQQDQEDIADIRVLYCSNCGSRLKPDKAFCHNCGMKVEDL